MLFIVSVVAVVVASSSSSVFIVVSVRTAWLSSTAAVHRRRKTGGVSVAFSAVMLVTAARWRWRRRRSMARLMWHGRFNNVSLHGFSLPSLNFSCYACSDPARTRSEIITVLESKCERKKKKGREYSTSLESLLLLSYFLLFVQEYEHERKKNFQFDCTYLQLMKSEIRCRVIRNRGECFLAYRLRRGRRRIVKCLVIGWQLIRFISRKFFFLRVTFFYSYKWRDW